MKSYINLFRGHEHCFELSYCTKKYTEFYWESYGSTSTSNTRCLKTFFTMVFQMVLCGECYENVYT
jgi:hypothetical protein